MEANQIKSVKCLLDEKATISLISNLTRRPLLKSNFRIYNDKGLRSIKLEILFYYESEKIKCYDDISNFFNRNNSNKFGLIIKDINELNDEFENNFFEWQLNEVNNYFYNFCQKRLIDFVLFIGNYGYTPFGIHNDIGDFIISQQIIYGEKKMFVFDRDYTSKNSGVNSYEIDNELKKAKRYNLQSGDILFFSGKNYHIGLTEDLSVGITIGLSDQVKFIKSISSIVSNSLNSLLADNYVKFGKISINVFYEEKLNHFIRLIKSNNYILNKFKHNYLSSSKIKGELFQINYNAKFLHFIDGEMILLYYSGRTISLENDEEIVSIIESILNFSKNYITIIEVEKLCDGKNKKTIEIIEICLKLEILKNL